jgi:histidinol-phosphate aminotransferase
VNQLTQLKALEVLSDTNNFKKKLEEVVEERKSLRSGLQKFSFVKNIFPSSANFWLVSVKNADELYHFLADNGIITRNRSKQLHCENCLRISIGTPEENQKLLNALKLYQS